MHALSPLDFGLFVSLIDIYQVLCKLSARLVRARGQVLDQVFNEDKMATKFVA